MKVEMVFVGKTTEQYMKDGVNEYLKRLKHYIHVEVIIVEPSGFEPGSVLKSLESEGERILKKIGNRDFVALLDERGKTFSSKELAQFIANKADEGISKLVIIVGGAYGVSENVKKRANVCISFSNFTFTHQMIRLLLVEQFYRAMTIIKRESYHH